MKMDIMKGLLTTEAMLHAWRLTLRPLAHLWSKVGGMSARRPRSRTSRPQPPQDQRHVVYSMILIVPVTTPDSSIFCLR